MRDALLKDLSSLDYQVQTTVDARLTPPIGCRVCREINTQDDVWQVWEEEIQRSEAVWLIAPETDGYLERMTGLAVKHNKKVIGCGLTAIKAFSSKLNTYQLLTQSNITTLPTYSLIDWPKSKGAQWLAKPDDGAGCEETVCFKKAEDLERWLLLNGRHKTHIIQPFIIGDAASISCVMHQGKAQVLSCNAQLIIVENNVLSYLGCIVNGMRQHWLAFEAVANKIARLLPGITGYIGIDLIVSDCGKQLTVVEVNPRLTTSYVALKEATGHNPAELIMHTCTKENYVWPTITQNEVRLTLSQYHA